MRFPKNKTRGMISIPMKKQIPLKLFSVWLKLLSQNDNKILKEELVSKIYAIPEKKNYCDA